MMTMTNLIILTGTSFLIAIVVVLIIMLTYLKKVRIIVMSVNRVLANMYSVMSGVEVADILNEAVAEPEDEDNTSNPEWFQG